MHNMRSDFLACFVWTWKTTEETVEIKTNDGLFAMVFHIYVSLHEDKIVFGKCSEHAAYENMVKHVQVQPGNNVQDSG